MNQKTDQDDFGSDSCIDAIRFRFCTPALAAIGWCSVTVTFMYAEWILGAVVKAQLILLTASDFRRGEVQVGCCCKDENWKKMFLGSIFTYQLFQNNQINVKKCEESEKNGFEALWKLQMVKK